jgi:hypothetical protein
MADVNKGTIVQVRCRSSFWSLGSVDLNEIGTSMIHLPRKDDSPEGEKGIILHVEVKVAAPQERCSVVIVIWKSTIESSTDMRISNDTDVTITVMQEGLHLDSELRKRGLFQMWIPPRTTVPFGWADPDLDGVVKVAVGEGIESAEGNSGKKKRLARLNMFKAGESVRLPAPSTRHTNGEIVLSVEATSGNRVLRVSRPSRSTPSARGSYSASDSGKSPQNAIAALAKSTDGGSGSNEASHPSKSVHVNIFLTSFGISLIVEKPVRREFLSLYMDNITYHQIANGNYNSYEFTVLNLQVSHSTDLS